MIGAFVSFEVSLPEFVGYFNTTMAKEERLFMNEIAAFEEAANQDRIDRGQASIRGNYASDKARG